MTKRDWNRIANDGVKIRVWHPTFGSLDCPGESSNQAIQFYCYRNKIDYWTEGRLCVATVIPQDEEYEEKLAWYVYGKWEENGWTT